MSLPSFLIDADAFHALRNLGLLAEVCRRLPADRPLLMTGHIAHLELVQLQTEIADLKSTGKLLVHEVVAKSPAGQFAKQLKRAGVDKGEAEAIAWAVETFKKRSDRPLFVSIDGPARRHATANGLIALDMMGAVVEWVEDGLLDVRTARRLTVIWDDRTQERGRPSDYDGFDNTYKKRSCARTSRTAGGAAP